MNKTYLGIDNGVSGTIASIDSVGRVTFQKIPVKKELSYTKAKQHISRIDVPKLLKVIEDIAALTDEPMRAIIERPMVNPTRFKATTSALRALEATIIVLEAMEIPYSYIDSRIWQKQLLPSGLKGDELKSASLDIGKRLFPMVKIKHPDCDGLLIAEYARRERL